MASGYGRRLALDYELIHKLSEARALSATVEVACDYAGIHPATYYRWMARAENEFSRMEEHDHKKPAESEEIFCEFYDAMKKAKGRAAISNLANIQRAANEGNWTASAWKLERAYPEGYGRRAVEISGPEGGPVRITDETDGEYTPQEVDSILGILIDAGVIPGPARPLTGGGEAQTQ